VRARIVFFFRAGLLFGFFPPLAAVFASALVENLFPERAMFVTEGNSRDVRDLRTGWSPVDSAPLGSFDGAGP